MCVTVIVMGLVPCLPEATGRHGNAAQEWADELRAGGGGGGSVSHLVASVAWR